MRSTTERSLQFMGPRTPSRSFSRLFCVFFACLALFTAGCGSRGEDAGIGPTTTEDGPALDHVTTADADASGEEISLEQVDDASDLSESIPDMLGEAVRTITGRPSGEEEDPVDSPADLKKGTVVCVHGWTSSPAMWLEAVTAWKDLDGLSFHLVTLPLKGTLSTMNACVQRLKDELALLEKSGVRKVHLVAHSMGGLVCRAYLRDRGDDGLEIMSLTMVATPNHGTDLAQAGGVIEKLADDPITLAEMDPDSEFLEKLNATPAPAGVKISSIWTIPDGVVWPSSSSVLSEAKNFLVAPPKLGIPHTKLLKNAVVQDLIAKILQGKSPETAGPQS